MPDKYKDKYRISSARLASWDYSSDGDYFVTICTGNREHYFGEVKDDKMCLSEIGKIVQSEWLKTPSLRPDMNLELDEFIVMPNHFHGIITIGENKYNHFRSGDYLYNNDDIEIFDRRDAMHCVSTTDHPDLWANKFGPQSKNLASVIRGFKSAVTTKARIINRHFTWQTRFHDHIIRNTDEWQHIKNYIINNPANWKDDKFYKSE
jgi:REP element-mobilizing transposase RayT